MGYRIQEVAQGFAVTVVPFSRAAVECLKTIPGRRYDPLRKTWIIPKSEQSTLRRLVEQFSATSLQSSVTSLQSSAEDGRPTTDDRRAFPADLWPHQVEALTYLWNRPAVLLDAWMGVGKSRIVLEYCNLAQPRLVLLLCPLSIMPAWEHQRDLYERRQARWVILDDRLSVTRKHHAVVSSATEPLPRVVVVNYESAWRTPLAEWLVAQEWDLLVSDECQHYKSPGSHISRFAHRLNKQARKHLALSGTPFPHSPLDAYGLYRALDPSIFGTNYARFRERYAVMGGYGNYKVLGWQHTEEFRQKMQAIRFFIPREVLHLPALVETLVPVRLPDAVYRNQYVLLERELYLQLAAGTVTAANAAVKLTRLQQLTSGYLPLDLSEGQRYSQNEKSRNRHPPSHLEEYQGQPPVIDQRSSEEGDLSLNAMGGACYGSESTGFPQGGSLAEDWRPTTADRPDDQSGSGLPEYVNSRELHWLHRAKLDALKDLLDGLDANEPVVIFARFLADLAAIRVVVQELGRASLELSGAHKDLQRWQSGEAPVLVAQIGAGALGVDMTIANRCIYYSLPLSLAQWEQSRARLHRPGQTRTTFVHVLAGDKTVDRRILQLLQERKEVLEGFLGQHSAEGR